MRVAILVIMLILISTDAAFNQGRLVAEILHRFTLLGSDFKAWCDQLAASAFG